MRYLMRGLFRNGFRFKSLFGLLLGLMVFPALATPIPLGVQVEDMNRACMECHADSDIQGASSDKPQGQLFVAPAKYHDSVHGGVPCIACHQSTPGSKGFAVTPHELEPRPEAMCESCHAVTMRDTVHAVQQSVHGEKIAKDLFSCTSCHDAHTMTAGEITQPGKRQMAESNLICTDCHSRAGVYTQLSKGKASKTQDMAHAALPYAAQHLDSLRCIDCHADTADSTLHRILPAEQAVSCEQCHQDGALLTARLKTPAPDEAATAGSMLGKKLFDDRALIAKLATVPADKPAVRQVDGTWFSDSYMIGNNGSDRFDGLYAYALAGLIGVLLCHGLGRFITRRRPAPGAVTEKSYLYTLPVRFWHWLNAICFAVLLISGFALHWVSGKFSLWVDVHNAAGLTLCAIWVGFIIVALCGNGHHYRVRLQGITGRLIRQTRYYLYGIFRGEPHPEHASPDAKFNILQQLGYIGVMFILMPLLIASGLLMMYPHLTPEHIFTLPGKQVIAYLHYGIALIMVMFIAVHLYLCSTGDTVGALVKGMIDGFHRTLKSPDAAKKETNKHH